MTDRQTDSLTIKLKRGTNRAAKRLQNVDSFSEGTGIGENRTKTENTIVAFTLARQKIWPRLEQRERGYLCIVFGAMRRRARGDSTIGMQSQSFQFISKAFTKPQNRNE